MMTRSISRLVGLAACLTLAVWPIGARALDVFACEPEWAALAVELGGDTWRSW